MTHNHVGASVLFGLAGIFFLASIWCIYQLWKGRGKKGVENKPLSLTTAEKAYSEQDTESKLRSQTPSKRGIDNISQRNMAFIMVVYQEMIIKHGHGDFLGLIADFADGVKLGELIEGKCKECGEPRNQKGKNE
jgi:hypothetical protein